MDDTVPPWPADFPPVHELVGLALRADRRRLNQSQRAYAVSRQISRDVLARAEVDASGMRLDTITKLLEGTGYDVVVVPTGWDILGPWWDLTDTEARTRGGGRFPAHREVKESPAGGPHWYQYHEVLGRRGDGTRPRWSAEGFTPPPGTRYGKVPTLGEDGRARWPFNDMYGDIRDGQGGVLDFGDDTDGERS